MNVKEIIKNRRKELGLTLLEVANYVGVSEATVSRWESGSIENMKRDKIYLLSKVLKTDPSYLMGWDNEEITKPKIDIMSSEERDIINKFKKLDDNGKSFVKSIIDREYQRCYPVKIEKLIAKGHDSDKPIEVEIRTDIEPIPTDDEF